MPSHSARLLSSSDGTRSVWHFGPPSSEGGRVGPHTRALNARTAADFTGALTVSRADLAGLPRCYAGLYALRCSETRICFLKDALCCLRVTPVNYQLQRLLPRATEPVIDSRRRHDGVPGPDGELLAVHPHDPTAGDEIVELLEDLLSFVDVGALAGSWRKLPDLDARRQLGAIPEKSTARYSSLPLTRVLKSPCSGKMAAPLARPHCECQHK